MVKVGPDEIDVSVDEGSPFDPIEMELIVLDERGEFLEDLKGFKGLPKSRQISVEVSVSLDQREVFAEKHTVGCGLFLETGFEKLLVEGLEVLGLVYLSIKVHLSAGNELLHWLPVDFYVIGNAVNEFLDILDEVQIPLRLEDQMSCNGLAELIVELELDLPEDSVDEDVSVNGFLSSGGAHHAIE